MTAELAEESFGLQREFPGGSQDERIDAAAGPAHQSLQDRKQEGGGLPGAGLGRPDQVSAPDRVRDRALLDRGGLGVSHLANARTQLCVEGEVLEGRRARRWACLSTIGVAHVRFGRPDLGRSMAIPSGRGSRARLKKPRFPVRRPDTRADGGGDPSVRLGPPGRRTIARGRSRTVRCHLERGSFLVARLGRHDGYHEQTCHCRETPRP